MSGPFRAVHASGKPLTGKKCPLQISMTAALILVATNGLMLVALAL
jgi:hypothetical protein